jgi:protein-disulfide isomerase
MSSTRDQGLTRKQRREQARVERKAREAAALARASQRKRLTQLGGVLGAVVATIAIIVVVTGGGSSKPPAPNSKAATADAAAAISLLQGIPQKANTLGYPYAPITIQYFGDLECPFCKKFTLTALPGIIQKDVRTGEAKIEYRSMETATSHKDVFETQQIAALAAGNQNLMWYYIELFYHEQGQENSGYVTESYLKGLAEQVPGLSISDWSKARNNPAYNNEIVTDEQTAIQSGFRGTPAFLIGKTGGSPQKFEDLSLTDPGPYEREIAKLLKS